MYYLLYAAVATLIAYVIIKICSVKPPDGQQIQHKTGGMLVGLYILFLGIFYWMSVGGEDTLKRISREQEIDVGIPKF